jgi:hypothetical protein
MTAVDRIHRGLANLIMRLGPPPEQLLRERPNCHGLARASILAAQGFEIAKHRRPDAAIDMALRWELGARAYQALAPAISPTVAQLVGAGLYRAAAEELADVDLDGEATPDQVRVALTWIAPHLPRAERELIYRQDVRRWVDEVRYAYETGGPRASVAGVDLDGEVNRALDELLGGA